MRAMFIFAAVALLSAMLWVACNLQGLVGGAEKFTVSTDTQTIDVRDLEIPAHLQGFHLLEGSAQRGAEVLKRLSCLECHSITPGEAGDYPNLSQVGLRLTASELVSSLVTPSRTFARGYKPAVFVELSSGEMVTGFEQEGQSSATTLTVITQEGSPLQIPRERIVQFKNGISDMPEGLVDPLSPQEFADLIAMLRDLR